MGEEKKIAPWLGLFIKDRPRQTPVQVVVHLAGGNMLVADWTDGVATARFARTTVGIVNHQDRVAVLVVGGSVVAIASVIVAATIVIVVGVVVCGGCGSGGAFHDTGWRHHW